MKQSVDSMVEELDLACHRSTDSPDGPPIVVIQRLSTKRRGRPKVHIDTIFLEEALALRGPSGVATALNCSSRTVRRRALELGLAMPGAPVVTTTTQPDGNVTQTYNAPPTGPAAAPAITDAQLDAKVREVLTVFPSFGRVMLAGHLTACGMRVRRDRLRASYIRVHGSPVAWGNRVIHRRRYKVAAANSLWHHDGQHGQ